MPNFPLESKVTMYCPIQHREIVCYVLTNPFKDANGNPTFSGIGCDDAHECDECIKCAVDSAKEIADYYESSLLWKS